LTGRLKSFFRELKAHVLKLIQPGSAPVQQTFLSVYPNYVMDVEITPNADLNLRDTSQRLRARDIESHLSVR